MNHLVGEKDIQTSILEVLASYPRHPENRLAMIRLLWQTTAGPIIARHTEIKTCTSDGKLILNVDDHRWIKEIQRVSEIILERINRKLLDLNRPEYLIHTLITTLSYQKKNEIQKVKNRNSTAVPNAILESASEMKDDLKKAFLEWYKTLNSKD